MRCLVYSLDPILPWQLGYSFACSKFFRCRQGVAPGGDRPAISLQVDPSAALRSDVGTTILPLTVDRGSPYLDATEAPPLGPQGRLEPP